MAHLLCHIHQGWYDPVTIFRFHANATTWLWWHAAVASWVEHWAGPGPAFAGNYWNVFDERFLFEESLQYPSSGSPLQTATAQRHGEGAGMVITNLVDSRGGPEWIPAMYQQHSGEATPVEALAQAGFDVGREWLEFARDYSMGSFYFPGAITGDSDSASEMKRHSLKALYRLDTPQSLPQTITWDNAGDLMAAAYRLEVMHGWPAGSKLMISLPQGGPEVVARVFQDFDPWSVVRPTFLGEFKGGEVMEIPDFDQYRASSLVIMLINTRAVKPFNGITPVQLHLAVESDEDELLEELRRAAAANKLKLYVSLRGGFTCGGNSCLESGMWVTNQIGSGVWDRAEFYPVQAGGGTFNVSVRRNTESCNAGLSIQMQLRLSPDAETVDGIQGTETCENVTNEGTANELRTKITKSIDASELSPRNFKYYFGSPTSDRGRGKEYFWREEGADAQAAVNSVSYRSERNGNVVLNVDGVNWPVSQLLMSIYVKP
ncbi:MAG: hypothetical protein GY953_13985 [bacterium]|nr:hypothetical protein [bacterium]